jgi:hypothetical protein
VSLGIAIIAFYALTSPWSVPYVLTEGDGTRDFAVGIELQGGADVVP